MNMVLGLKSGDHDSCPDCSVFPHALRGTDFLRVLIVGQVSLAIIVLI